MCQNRACGFLKKLKESGHPGRIIFSDEKNFVVDPAFNPQNDRYICFYEDSNKDKEDGSDQDEDAAETFPPPNTLLVQGTPQAPCFWGLSRLLERYPPRGNILFVGQQDSAPAHRTKKTISFLKEQNIPFWTPEEWPPNSSDLNPLDFAIWSMVQQGACKDRPPSVADLKKRVSTYWKRMDPDEIRTVCRRFRARLHLCVDSKDSFFN